MGQKMREFNMAEDSQQKWIVLDGPIDALFVENLNSVMDETKTLHLPNGEIIKIKSNFRLLF